MASSAAAKNTLGRLPMPMVVQTCKWKDALPPHRLQWWECATRARLSPLVGPRPGGRECHRARSPSLQAQASCEMDQSRAGLECRAPRPAGGAAQAPHAARKARPAYLENSLQRMVRVSCARQHPHAAVETRRGTSCATDWPLAGQPHLRKCAILQPEDPAWLTRNKPSPACSQGRFPLLQPTAAHTAEYT